VKSLSTRLSRRMSSIRGNDRGATLLYALIFTTVLSVILASILALADTNLRGTKAVRDQAALAAAADGAAKIAINNLRLGTFSGATGTDCWGGSGMTVPYTDPEGVSHTLNVACTADPNTTIGQVSASHPGAALITLDTANSTTPLNINISGNGTTTIAGNVIMAGQPNNGQALYIQNNDELDIEPSVDSSGNPSGAPSTLQAPKCTFGNNKSILKLNGTQLTKTSSPCTTAVANPDPGYLLPSLPTTGTLPSCTNAKNNVLTIQPGLYTSASALTALMSCAQAPVVDFRPGIYYFNFASSDSTWNINTAVTVVGGSPTPVQYPVAALTNPLQPGLCADPARAPVAGAGVQFVFGATAHLSVGGSHTTTPRVELCGRTFDKNSPVVLYGNGTTGNLFTTANANADVYLKGIVYAPAAGVTVIPGMGNSALNVYFLGGVVAKDFAVGSPNSTTFSTPVVSLPTGSTTYSSRLVAVLNVSLDGKSLLKAKVGFTDPSGTPQAGNRGVTVYSWSVER
jgi:hypothetical protein